MALLTSIGVAGIPSASLVAIIVILHSVGFPDATISIGVGIVFVVDRLLDMTRTAVNVLGDSCAAAIIGKSEGETGYYPSNPGWIPVLNKGVIWIFDYNRIINQWVINRRP